MESGAEDQKGGVVGSGEAELMEGVRDALRLQRLPEVDPKDIAERVHAAVQAMVVANAASERARGANQLEDAASLSLGAIKAHEEAARLFKELKASMRDSESVSAGNGKLLRLAVARIVAMGMTDLGDEHHDVEATEGQPSLEIVDEQLIPFEYLRSTPDNAAVKAALLDGKEVPGARLVYGDPGIKITAKAKTKGRKAKT